LQHFTKKVKVALQRPVVRVLSIPSQRLNRIGSYLEPLLPREVRACGGGACLRRLLSLAGAVPVRRAAPRVGASTRQLVERAAQPGMAAPETGQRQFCLGFHADQYIGIPTGKSKSAWKLAAPPKRIRPIAVPSRPTLYRPPVAQANAVPQGRGSLPARAVAKAGPKRSRKYVAARCDAPARGRRGKA
jgi:hypothetical protein